MILVDIGNSGLRAVRMETGSRIDDARIWKLSWPANFHVKGKGVPHQHQTSNHKWCEQDDAEAFRWLVSSIDPQPFEKWIVSSVKQTALEQLENVCHNARQTSPFRKLSYMDIPVQIDVDSPEKVGMDRLISSWEAWNLINIDKEQNDESPNLTSERPVITVQAGTAVTVDLITGDGRFQGGAIMPGLGLSLQLLAAGTEQLPWIANGAVFGLPSLPGKNTSSAIAAGVHASLVGGATFLINRYRQESGNVDIPVIVTGGDASVLASFIKPPCIPMDHMVLRGLSRLITTKQLT